MRKRLLPILLFDKAAATSGNSVAPQLNSVFGEGNVSASNDFHLPLFPKMSATDQKHLVKYFLSCKRERGNNEAPVTKKTILQPDKDGKDVAWTDDDEMHEWTKLRIFQSSQPSGEKGSKMEERTIGKILSVDNKCKKHAGMYCAFNMTVPNMLLGLHNNNDMCLYLRCSTDNQDGFRLGLGLVTLSALTTGGTGSTCIKEKNVDSDQSCVGSEDGDDNGNDISHDYFMCVCVLVLWHTYLWQRQMGMRAGAASAS